MTTNLIVPATEYTCLNAVRAAAAEEAAEAAYLEGLGFEVGEEVATLKIGFVEAAARATEVVK
tara:strand:- start:165 stop:353 length:189 start_codon:yes stop_codon:yes gene_type:complete